MTLTMPPAPSGSPQQMAMAQYAYLFQMAQQLNLALGQLETGGAGTSSSGGGTAGGGGTGKDSRADSWSICRFTSPAVFTIMDFSS